MLISIFPFSNLFSCYFTSKISLKYNNWAGVGGGVWGGGVGEAGGGGAVVKSLNKMYKSSQQLSFTMFIYLHDTKMLSLY